jgi:hypothetical protein
LRGKGTETTVVFSLKEGGVHSPPDCHPAGQMQSSGSQFGKRARMARMAGAAPADVVTRRVRTDESSAVMDGDSGVPAADRFATQTFGGWMQRPDVMFDSETRVQTPSVR